MTTARHINLRFGTLLLAAVLAAHTLLLPNPARAEMVLSKVIVDLQSGKPAHDDIEVWNDGTDRMYVLAEAAEVIDPGLITERRVTTPDPMLSGLLVTPQRLVLEPGQRRIVRVSAIAPRPVTDRVYRVTIKPVAGPISAEVTALKVYVGYDALVLYRPSSQVGGLDSKRVGRSLTITNGGNTAIEVFDGRQCDPNGKSCIVLKSARLYAGASIEQNLTFDTPVQYHLSDGRKTTSRQF